MSRALETAKSQQSNSGPTPPIVAGKNFIINGGMDIWQRGTSFASTNGYFADRWTNAGILSNVTASRQTTGAPDGFRYICRLTSTGADSYWSSYQYIETSMVSPLWGKTVTASVKLRTNSTANNTGLAVIAYKNSAVDATAGSGGWVELGRTTVDRTSLPITAGTSTATWHTATFNFAVPNDGTCNSIFLTIGYNGATANGSIYEFTGVQLELGSTATTFSRAGGTIQGELAACQRYYYQLGYLDIPAAYAASTTTTTCIVKFPVQMRTAPTGITVSTTGDWRVYNQAGGFGTSTAITFNNGFTTGTLITVTTGAGSPTLTAGSGGFLYGVNPTAAIGFTGAEL